MQVYSFFDRVKAFGYDGIKAVYARMGYRFYDNGEYNVNIFGVRKNNPIAGLYDDILGYAAIINGEKVLQLFHGTTDPGTTCLKKPSNEHGCAILVEGQYLKTWTIGTHAKANPNFAHKALCQTNGKVRVYRDDNRDNTLDFDKSSIEEGYFGINIHRASKYRISDEVGNYSAGCQVFQSHYDFDKFMSVIVESSKRYGNMFSYTLFTEKQIFD